MGTRLTTPDGNVVEVYEPPNSGDGPMRRGHCPGCGKQTWGFIGRCGAIREVASDGTVANGTNYGHLDCVELMYESMIASGVYVTELADADEVVWIEGTQREYLDFLASCPSTSVVCTFNYQRHKSRRYRWCVEDNQ